MLRLRPMFLYPTIGYRRQAAMFSLTDRLCNMAKGFPRS